MSSANYVITPSVISEGDVNGDDNIDLEDVITALQIITDQHYAEDVIRTPNSKARLQSFGKISV